MAALPCPQSARPTALTGANGTINQANAAHFFRICPENERSRGSPARRSKQSTGLPGRNPAPLQTCYMSRYRQAFRRAAFAAGLALISPFPASAQAQAFDYSPLQFFSDCLGRVSALRVHRWSYGDTRGEARAEAMRLVLADLVDTMTPPEHEGQVLTWKAQAQAAQATLMLNAALYADPEAEALAESLIARCAGMIVVPDSADQANDL
jgi:hypothetical protein